mmetsp:Transcript_16658/g.45509  ORF Transcript_16658/g.45509 Transcript_16658/m.45509 type:complete len:226 (+) Transcript_16658:289-966(+)
MYSLPEDSSSSLSPSSAAAASLRPPVAGGSCVSSGGSFLSSFMTFFFVIFLFGRRFLLSSTSSSSALAFCASVSSSSSSFCSPAGLSPSSRVFCGSSACGAAGFSPPLARGLVLARRYARSSNPSSNAAPVVGVCLLAVSPLARRRVVAAIASSSPSLESNSTWTRCAETPAFVGITATVLILSPPFVSITCAPLRRRGGLAPTLVALASPLSFAPPPYNSGCRF